MGVRIPLPAPIDMTILKKRDPRSINLKIQGLMDLYKVNQAQLAKLWNVSPGYICDIVSGKRSISPRVAIRLEATFGIISAEEWMRLKYQEEINQLRSSMTKELERIAEL